jgi:hypothetical protein
MLTIEIQVMAKRGGGGIVLEDGSEVTSFLKMCVCIIPFYTNLLPYIPPVMNGLRADL